MKALIHFIMACSYHQGELQKQVYDGKQLIWAGYISKEETFRVANNQFLYLSSV